MRWKYDKAIDQVFVDQKININDIALLVVNSIQSSKQKKNTTNNFQRGTQRGGE